ncbi:MAG: hypothetical protein N3I35_18095 [Clostridia bacterium]|nr:hypothetical protein [Clostridia bacterium]
METGSAFALTIASIIGLLPQAAIPQLVPPSKLTKADGFGQMINSATSMVGPMLGAFLMSITTLQYVMLVDILGAFLTVSTLSFVKIRKHLINHRIRIG